MTALPEAETKRVKPFPPQCSSSSSCPPSSLSLATIFTRAISSRTLGASWCLPSSAPPYRLLWLVVASICLALPTLSTRLHLYRASHSAHSLVLLTPWRPLLYFRHWTL